MPPSLAPTSDTLGILAPGESQAAVNAGHPYPSKARQCVQRPRETDEGEALGERINQYLLGIPYIQIGFRVSLSLGAAPAKTADGAERDQLPLLDTQTTSGIEILETVGGEIVLDVLQFRVNPKFCVKSIQGENRAIFIWCGSRGIRLPPFQ